MSGKFDIEYKKLNGAQKEAVDSLSGPVMVVAGPGTGKTQVLSMRIANILTKTDVKADGVLCLTFTNSAVEAMKARLASYLGEAGELVNVFTFHSFGMEVIRSYYSELGLATMPRLLDEQDTAIFLDEVLGSRNWEYIRPRSDRSRYFRDLSSLISLLKRERITSADFSSAVESEIKNLKDSKLKKDFKKIESLEKSLEVAQFFDLYEEEKKRKNLLDYDDVLENLVRIVESSPSAASDIREKYLYVLVDEHQDSSRVQNDFLRIVWGDVESPEIFVVGDDRQLIYGFSGASIDHFAGFKKTFKGAKLITLVDNYRSTQVILDASHALLQSVMTDAKLRSQSKDNHPIRLFEAPSAGSEILAAAIDIKEKIKNGVKAEECAILVPKNSQVRDALKILHSAGLPVSSLEALNLFEQEDAVALIRILKIIGDTADTASLARSFLDRVSGVKPLEAHEYFVSQNMREFSWEKLINQNNQTLFNDGVAKWVAKLKLWQEWAQSNGLVETIERIGKDVLLNTEGIVKGEDIFNTIISLVNKEKEKREALTLREFVETLERLDSFDSEVGLVAQEKKGVKVLTLHSSKGLEFEYVWIAHMDERSLAGGGRGGFTLPEAIADKVLERDIDRVKRKLYVAITRAKKFCTISYSRYSKSESEQELAGVIADLSEEVFKKESIQEVKSDEKVKKEKEVSEIVKQVGIKYKERNVTASLLNNFYECTWKWYFRNILQLPEPESEILVFGSRVHAAVDQILRANKLVLPENAEVADIVRAWAAWRLPEIAKDRENEKSISFADKRFPHLKIYGRIDLIEKLDSKNVRVTDFKTGSVRKKSEIEKLDEEGRLGNNLRQLAMYSYLLANNSKQKVSESRLEFLEAKNPKESIYEHVVTPPEINLLLKDITDYDELARSGEWTERECNYNSYGKGGECPYHQLAEIFK